MLSRLTIALAAVFLATGSAAAGPTYVYTTVNDPVAAAGGGDTTITGINDAGTLTGFYRDTISSPTFHSFVDIGGSFSTIDEPPALAARGSTFANGINNAGEIVGFYTAASGVSHGFTYLNGNFTTIDVPGAAAGTTQVFGINNLGVLAGTYIGQDGVQHGFVDVSGTFLTIDDPAASAGTSVLGINDHGVLTGIYNTNTHVPGFVDNGGVFTTIVNSAVPFDAATESINNGGHLVGQYIDDTSQTDFGGSFLDIGGMFTPIDDPLALLSVGGTVALGINNDETIVGEYFSSDTAPGAGFVATLQPDTAVPEPTSLAILMTGLVGFTIARRPSLRRSRLTDK